MRILKKVIRKLYHLIWFLSICLIFTPNVFASGAGVVKTDGASYEVAAFADFADNTNGHLTRVNATFIENGHYFRSNQSLQTNGANTDGVNLLFDSNTSFVAGYTYLVSILVSMRDTYAKPSSTRVCIAETLTNVTTRFNNPGSFPCFYATVTATNGTAAFSDGNITLYYAVLNYIFTADATGNSITMTYNTVGSIESNHTFGGYSVTLLSDNKQLTQQQVQQAVQNSGLATAQSVTQVQQSITQVQQELGSIDNTLNDSSVDSSDSTINNLKSKIPTNSVISDLLLLPVRFLQNFVNALGSSCSQFNLGSLYGTNLYMPCINIESYLGSGIWTTIDLIISGLFVYALRKKFIEIYENLTNLKNGGNEVD